MKYLAATVLTVLGLLLALAASRGERPRAIPASATGDGGFRMTVPTVPEVSIPGTKPGKPVQTQPVELPSPYVPQLPPPEIPQVEQRDLTVKPDAGS